MLESVRMNKMNRQTKGIIIAGMILLFSFIILSFICTIIIDSCDKSTDNSDYEDNPYINWDDDSIRHLVRKIIDRYYNGDNGIYMKYIVKNKTDGYISITPFENANQLTLKHIDVRVIDLDIKVGYRTIELEYRYYF